MLAVRRLVAVAISAGLLLVAGCGGEDAEPEAAPSSPVSTPSASPTESESPGELEMPAEAKQKNQAGAEAFLEHWVEAVYIANSTGDTAELDAISLPGCESCKRTSRWVREHYADGGSVDAARVRLGETTELVPKVEDDVYNLIVEAVSPREVLHYGDGKKETKPKATLNLVFDLKWRDGDWGVFGWTVSPG